MDDSLPPSRQKISVTCFDPYEEENLPIWFYIHENSLHGNKEENKGYTTPTIWLLNGLIYYWGEVFIRNDKKLKWESFYKPNSDLYFQYFPVIKGLKINIYPFDQIFTFSVGTWSEDEEISSKLSVNNLYDAYIKITEFYKV